MNIVIGKSVTLCMLEANTFIAHIFCYTFFSYSTLYFTLNTPVKLQMHLLREMQYIITTAKTYLICSASGVWFYNFNNTLKRKKGSCLP